MSLESEIAQLAAAGSSADRTAAREAFVRLREAMSSGAVRAAEPDSATPVGWRVNTWVKQGILLGFRFGDIVDVSGDHGGLPFYDKDTLPLKRPGAMAGIRIAPGPAREGGPPLWVGGRSEAAIRRADPMDHPEDRPLPERCLWFPVQGPPMLPGIVYNSNYEIVQTPTHVLLFGREISSPAWGYVTIATAGVLGNTLGCMVGWAIGTYGRPPLLEQEVHDGADLGRGEAREHRPAVRGPHAREQALRPCRHPFRQQAAKDADGLL